MKLIDYARSPLHRRADTARAAFILCTPLKGKPMDAFSSDLATFTNQILLSPPFVGDARAIPFLFSALVFDAQYTAKLPSFYVPRPLATLLRSSRGTSPG